MTYRVVIPCRRETAAVGKRERHGGDVQVAPATDGWTPWTSDVRPGRELHLLSSPLGRTDPALR
ncbi:hypothetical protein I0C86_14230 [Plantactinospora sp. S1510]|uniref:Uncharacterized protein n=1 Tax=Plantactinospora alkalitolerans TaxID=2789879 RepID=A0ABS0GW32_9ACTN|nr:hypothetical protein [Plantactinospora alkalitolerans]MBF9130107.1 hypothetical protein [Plantactinospora alkalitolerans]